MRTWLSTAALAVVAMIFAVAPASAGPCDGDFPAGYLCGNPSGVTDAPTASPFTSYGQFYSIPIKAAASGSPNSIVLTPSVPISSLVDGMRFRFSAPFTSTTASFPSIGSIAGVVGGPWPLVQPDGYTKLYQYDIQSGATMDVIYIASGAEFAVLTPYPAANNLIGANFAHGMYKLQAGSSVALNLNGNDGGAVVGYNNSSGGYRLVRLGPGPECSQPNLFNNTANVENVTNQSLASNTLYAVYLNPQDGVVNPSSPPANTCLSFWRMSAGYYPNIEAHGIYVLNSGGTPNTNYIYLGAIYTGANDISNLITPSSSCMGNAVFSHSTLSRWSFGYQTNTASNPTSSSTLTTQAQPCINTVTEGIDSSPTFHAKAIATCDTSGVTASFRIKVTGTQFDGSAYGPNYSTTTSKGVGYANEPIELTASWSSAPSIGFYTAKTDIATTGGNCTFVTDIIGYLPQ